MPIIDILEKSADTEYIEGYFWLGFDIEAELGILYSFPPSPFSFGITGSATMSIDTLIAEDTFGVDISPDSVLRLDADDPNVFLAAEGEFGLELQDLIIPVRFDLLGIFDMGIDMRPFDFISPTRELDELLITLDIFPIVVFPGNYQEYKVRFKIDGEEVPIRNFSIKAPKNTIGTDLSVSLSNLEDRSRLIDASLYSLEVATVISGVTTWREIASGPITGSGYSLGWQNMGPTDEVFVSVGASLAQRINISPLRPVVFYDSSSTTIRPEDFDPIYDSGGGIYTPLIIGVGGLTLYTILSYVFGQCGLAFETNLPNFRVPRLDIQIGQSFYDAVGGLMAAFDPILLERDGIVYILDGTMILPSGFDAPKVVTPSKYRTVSIDKAFSDINGYIISYVQNQNAWDRYDDDVISTTNEIIDENEGTVTTINTDTYIRSFTRNSMPSVIVRQETTMVIVETFVLDPVIYGDVARLITRTVENFTYDGVGKLLIHTKEELQQVPIWVPSPNPASAAGDGNWEYQFRSVRHETDEYTYKDNPFSRGTQYKDTMSQTTRAFIYIDPDKVFETKDNANVLDIDPDKEVPIDYKQEYVTAYRSGNLQDDGETEYGPIMVRFERVTPISEDLAKVETKEVDFLNKVTTVSVAEEQVGVISTFRQVATRRTAIYLGGGTRDSRRLESFNIGEIPVEYGFALAQRKFVRNNLKNTRSTMDLIGIDLAVKRGTILKAVGRDSEVLGSYLVDGYSIDGKDLGTSTQVITSKVEGIEV